MARRLLGMGGVSANTGYLAGNPNASWDSDSVRLAVITALQNNSDSQALPCYSYTLLRERDPIFPAPNGDKTQAITYDAGLSQGDFSAIDPTVTSPPIYLAPAYEVSGNTGVPTDGSAIVELHEAHGGRHYWFIWPGDSAIFPATLTRRMKILSDPSNVWEYAWTRDTYSDPEGQTQGTVEEGTLPVDIKSEHTQSQCVGSPDIYTMTMSGATGGSYSLTEDGGTPTVPIAYNASAATVLALLSVFTDVSVTTVGTGTMAVTTLVFTSNDNTAPHSITMATSGSEPLTPEKPHYPAVFRNNIAMDVKVAVHLKKASGSKSKVVAGVETQGSLNGQVHAVLTLYVDKARDGTFTIKLLDTDTAQKLKYNCGASDIVAAILALGYNVTVTGTGTKTDPFLITFLSTTAPASDYNQHELIIDSTNTFGTAWYIVVWSNGSDCMAALGGRYPPEMLGYTAAIPYGTTGGPAVTIDPSSPGVGPWTIKVTGATGGSYDIVVDSGSPVVTGYNGLPVITGFTATFNPDGSVNLVGDGSPHSIQVYGCKLRSSPPVQFPGIIPTNCVKLFPADNECDT